MAATIQASSTDWQVDGWWFHCFRSFVDGGHLARMSGSTCKIYLAIKSFANYRTGLAGPALATIATKSGLSLSQVKRGLHSLCKSGLILKQKSGRHNVYQFVENFPLIGANNVAVGVGRWDYVPSKVAAVTEELKRFVTTQSMDDSVLLRIEKLRVQGDPSIHGVQLGDFNLESLPVHLRKMLEKILLGLEKQRAALDSGPATGDFDNPQVVDELGHE